METKKYTSKDIELRSEEANDILNAPPPRLLRISNVVIFFIALILLLLSFTVTIPIYSKIPVHLEPFKGNHWVQEGETRLDQLTVKPFSFQKVKKGQIIGISNHIEFIEINKLNELMENNLNYNDKSVFKEIDFSKLGKLENDYLEYKFGKISMHEFYLKFVDWKKENLIVSEKKGKLFIEINKSGIVKYKIYPDNITSQYMIAEVSQENLEQLKKDNLFLRIISPGGFKNNKFKISLINDKYLKNNDKFEVVFEINNSLLFSNISSIDGEISVLLREEKFINLLLPFLKSE